MILYLHGFASSALSKKADIVREYFKDNVICPNLSHIPALALDTAEQIINLLLKRGENVSLMGSSAGGYLSIYLANKYNLKAVLINPAIYPYKLTDFVGLVKCYYDGSSFECTQEHIEFMQDYEVASVKNQKNFMLLLQKGDELLDYHEAVEKFHDAKIILEEGGSHSFDGFEHKMGEIEKFLCQNI